MTKTLYIVRHGESEANQGGKTQPDKQIPLTELGIQQAQNVADRLSAHLPHVGAVYTSEMLRTQQTGRFFCQQHAITPKILPCLNEFSIFDHNDILGLTGEQRRPLTQAYWQRANPDERCGELADTFTEFNQRIDDFLKKCQAFPDNSVCFGHGIWIGLLSWRLLGFGSDSVAMKAFRPYQTALPMPNCAVYRLRYNTELIQLTAGVGW